MVKCPFCGFANEDGALFCEQCKSDVSNVGPSTSQPSFAPPTPMPEPAPAAAEAIPLAQEEPVMAAIVEEAPPAVEAIPLVAEEAPPAAQEVAPVPAAEVAPPPPPPYNPAATPPEPAPAVAAAAVVAPVAAAAAPAPAPAPAAAPSLPAPAGQTPIPAGAQVKLLVQRGLKVGEEYNIFPGDNYIGRADEKPVDVDLTFQEPEDRVWCSRQHALMVYDDATGSLTIEDLNSSNGTFVNRERVYPGQPRQLYVGNTVQIGTVHMKVKV